MPANWDYYQNINFGTSRVEWPTGPMDLTNGFYPRWVEAWVVQSSLGDPSETSGAGASQSTSQRANWQPGYDRWTADGIPAGLGKRKLPARFGIGDCAPGFAQWRRGL